MAKSKYHKLSLDECIYRCMRNGDWWTFWDLQKTIDAITGKYYGEPTISAGIRNLRKPYNRDKFNLSMTDEVIIRKRIEGKKGYKYKLIMEKANV